MQQTRNVHDGVSIDEIWWFFRRRYEPNPDSDYPAFERGFVHMTLLDSKWPKGWIITVQYDRTLTAVVVHTTSVLAVEAAHRAVIGQS